MIHDDPEYLRDPRIKATCAPLVAAAEAAASTWCSCAWTMTAEHRSAGRSTHRLAQVDPRCPTHGTVDGPSVHGERPGGSGAGEATAEGSGGATAGPFAPRRPLTERIADAIPYELTATPHVGVGTARRLKIAHAVRPVIDDEFEWLSAALGRAQEALREQISERDELRRQVQAVRDIVDQAIADERWAYAWDREHVLVPIADLRKAIGGE